MDRKRLIRNPFIWILVAILVYFSFSLLFDDTRGYSRVDTSVAIAQIEGGNVTEALVEDPDLLERTRDPEALSETLVGLRGVGPWTAAYVSMRVLNAPDVPLPGDAAVATGARLLGVDDAAAAYGRVRPFRSSFTIHAWNAAAGG